MRQAIVTKWLGPTNHRGSRVKATAAAGSVTVAWDYALGIEANHAAAAVALIEKLEWSGEGFGGRWVAGGLPDGSGNAYVYAED